jgi:hypothetical protein
MILTDYYKFTKLACKSKTRLDCVASTMSYPPLEEKRMTRANKPTEKRDGCNVGDLLVYLGDVPEQFSGNAHRKADKNLTIKGNNLSSIFVPDPANNLGYGDVKGTSDALLFVMDLDVVDGIIQNGGAMEIFVARGLSKNRVPLFNLLADGELDDELDALRKMATVTKSVTA